MVRIRPPSSRLGINCTIPSFAVGLLVGLVAMYICMMPLAMHQVANSSTGITGSTVGNTPLSTAATATTTQGKENGWHTINVFYGERSGLGADPKQVSYAQVHQDDVVLDLLGKSGYFIDLAANDALELTNTLALERYDWNGLCIEPNPVYWYGLSHRKCTVVGALMGDEKKQVDVQFRGVYGGIVGKMDKRMADRKKEPNAVTEKRYLAPLKDVLDRFRVPKLIDYMSLDIEGAEYLVMQNFPFDEYRIKVLTVERPNKSLKELFAKHGYVFLKDLAWWGETLWAHESTGFTPSHPKIANIVTEGK